MTRLMEPLVILLYSGLVLYFTTKAPRPDFYIESMVFIFASLVAFGTAVFIQRVYALRQRERDIEDLYHVHFGQGVRDHQET
jgi:hypothetical protein